MDQGPRSQRRVRHADDQRTEEKHHFRARTRLHGGSDSSLQLHKGFLQQGHSQADRQGHEAFGGVDTGRTLVVA